MDEKYKLVANDEPETCGVGTDVYTLGVGSNYEGKCAATVIVWGAGIGKEEVDKSIKHKKSPMMTGGNVQDSTLFLQKNANLSIQGERLNLLSGNKYNINMNTTNPRSGLKKQLDDLQGSDFYLLRLRPIDKNIKGGGHALGLRKLPPEKNNEPQVFEIFDPNGESSNYYKGTDNAINAILVEAANYKTHQLESLEKYQVKTVRDMIEKLLSNKDEQKVENKNKGNCTLQ